MTDVCVAPSLFVNHGGGPMPVYGGKSDVIIAQSLQVVPKFVDLLCLNAIILVTAHWEEDVVAISSVEKPDLYYDYYNFPPETYTYKYGGRGDPALARRIHDALSSEGIPSKLDDVRGWDHGVFIPMMLIRPEADIPIVQVSILKNHNASQHYELGRALAKFRKEGIAIIGSGLSYHNLMKIKSAESEPDDIQCAKFDAFLNEVLTGDELAREEIVRWREAPESYDAHPEGEADHMMPLIVNAGAGGEVRGKNVWRSVYRDKFMISGFIWE